MGLSHHQPLEPILSAQSVESSQENSVKQLDDSSNGDRYVFFIELTKFGVFYLLLNSQNLITVIHAIHQKVVVHLNSYDKKI